MITMVPALVADSKRISIKPEHCVMHIVTVILYKIIYIEMGMDMYEFMHDEYSSAKQEMKPGNAAQSVGPK